MDLGGVRRKMTCKNCEPVNTVKTVAVLKTLVRCRTMGFFKWYGNIILMPTVVHRIWFPTVKDLIKIKQKLGSEILDYLLFFIWVN